MGQSPPPLPMAHPPRFPPWVPPRGPEPIAPEATATCDCWQWYGNSWKKQRTQSYKQARVYKQQSTWQATSSSQCWQWCGGRWQAHRYKEAHPYRPAWQETKTSEERTYWRRWYYAESNHSGGHWYRRPICRSTDTTCSNSQGAPSSSRSHMRMPCGLLASEVSDLLFRDITPDDYEMLLQLDENVPRPTASQALVDSLPHASFEDCLGETCAVCLTAFESCDSITYIPSCKHKFHRGCISKWLLERNKVCPLCGNEVSAA